MSFGPIDPDLGEQWKTDLVFGFTEGRNLGLASGFLPAELVTGKSEHLETA
jgi:hypothetical protein